MRSFTLFVLVFFLVFGPRTYFLDFHGVLVFLAGIVGLTFFLSSRRSPEPFHLLVLACFPIILYSAAMSILYGAADLTILWLYIKLLIYFFAGLFVFSVARSLFPDSYSEKLFVFVWLCAVFNALFTVLVIVFPTLRAFSSRILDLEGKQHWVEGAYRSFDLSMGGGAIAATVFAVILFAGVIGNRQIGNTFLLIAGSWTLALAAMLTGRTGSVLIAVGGVSFFGYLVFSVLLGKLSITQVFRGVILHVLVPCALIWGVLLLSGGLSDVASAAVIAWAFEGLTFLGPDGVSALGQNESLNRILDYMIFIPPSDGDLLFGTSNAGRSEFLPYVPTDVGYLRIISAVGIVGLALAAVPFCVAAFYAARNLEKSPSAACALIFIAGLCLVNAKELMIAPRAGALVLAVWFSLATVPDRFSCTNKASVGFQKSAL